MPRRSRSRFRATSAQQRTASLDRAQALMTRGQFVEAYDILEPLALAHPDDLAVQHALAAVAHELRDAELFLQASERLSALLPDDPDTQRQLAGAYLLNDRPALALRAFRRFLERWPQHPEAATAREVIEALEADLGPMLAEAGLTGDDAPEIAALHEQVQALLYAGRYAESRSVAEQVLARAPQFAPALNNLSLLAWLEGDLQQAAALAERVLSFDPDNIHALSNLTRFACLLGRIDQARTWAARLKTSRGDAVDRTIKIMEALSYLGDDQGVLDAFEAAQSASRRASAPLPAIVLHLAAVAAMRLGQHAQATRLWRRALRAEPDFDLAQANLDDLQQPIGERHAPWPFNMEDWINRATVEQLAAEVQAASRHGDQEITQTIKRVVTAHPYLADVAPLLLDRGDPDGREFACQLAVQLQSPALLGALRDFALSQRGPDQLRLEAAQRVSEAGLLQQGPVQLWMEGEWRDLMLLNFELHDDPPRPHKPKVARLLGQALASLRRQDGAAAEALLKQALAIEPDAPDLSNNLALAYEQQGRREQAEALLRENHQRHPAYVLGRVSLARLELQRGRIEAARTMLNDVLALPRLHFAELAALAGAQIDLALAEENINAAESWLSLWSSVDPEHPGLAGYRQRLQTPRRRPGGAAVKRQRGPAARRSAPAEKPPAEAESPRATPPTEQDERVPAKLRPLYDEIVAITDAVCAEHLDAEYAALSRKMAASLSRKRPSPLLSGRPRSWAGAILYALGRVNFLFDRSQTPHLSATELCSICGISQATASAKANQIMDSLKINMLDQRWSRRSLIENNPLTWLLEVNGQLVDARDLPRELQEQALELGLLPFLPDEES